jgi:hypothetical protein
MSRTVMTITAAIGLGLGVTAGGAIGVPAPPEPSAGVLLRVDTRGGYTDAATQFRIVSSMSVYADGGVIFQAPKATRTDLRFVRLDADGLERVKATIRAAGVVTATAPDYGIPQVTDMPATTISVDLDGVRVDHTAYALGAGFDDDPSLNGAQMKARKHLTSLIDDLDHLSTLVGREHVSAPAEYVEQRIALQATVTPRELLPRSARRWPAPRVNLARARVCLVVNGPRAHRIAKTLGKRDPYVLYVQGGRYYQVNVRPLLPDQHDCRSAGLVA